MDRRIRPHPCGRRLRRARGSVALGLRMELDDLGPREDVRRRFGEPHHQDGSLREVGRMEARDSFFPRGEVGRVQVESGRPDDDWHACSEAARHIRADCVRRREVDRRVAALRPFGTPVDDLVPCGPQGRREQRADLPGAAVQGDPHQAASPRARG